VTSLVTWRFAIFDFLSLLYWHWHKFEVRSFNYFVAKLALNAQKIMGSRDPGHAPFTLFWHSGVGSRQDTSFELWTAIIGQQTNRRCKRSVSIGLLPLKMHYVGVNWVKWGKKIGDLWPPTNLNETFFSFQVPVVCAKFRRNGLIIATVTARTDRQTDRHNEVKK